MTNTRETAVKYLKIYILSLLFVFIIDYFINGSLMNDDRIIEYLFVDILPLSCIFIIGWIFEFILKKRYMKDFNLSLYFISSAVFSFIFVQLYNYINPLPEVTYQTYTHAGILIFFIKILIIAITLRERIKSPCGASFKGVEGWGKNGPTPIISKSFSLKNKISSAKDSILCPGSPTREPLPVS